MLYLQVEANTIYLERKFFISKVHNLQGGVNAITAELNSTRIKKEETEEKTHQLKYVISGNSRILDNKCPDNV